MFLVIELQVNANGVVGNLVTTYNTLTEAQNKFYTVCASAVISALPIHSVILIDHSGVMIDRQSFVHPVEIEPESEVSE